MNSPSMLRDPIPTFMAFVPLAALAALAATTTALTIDSKNRKSSPYPVLPPPPRPRETPTVIVKPSPNAQPPPGYIELPVKKGGTASNFTYMANNNNGRNGSNRNRRRRRVNNTTVVRAPTTIGGVTRNLPMSMISNGGRLTINHCEPFGTVSMTALGVLAFQRFGLIPAVFPYLTGIASNFGKYAWRRLHIYYVPSCPTSTEGEVAMGLFYDVQDMAAATFTQVAALAKAVSFPPWSGGPAQGPGSAAMEVDCTRFDKPRYSYVTTAVYNPLSTSDKNNYTPVSFAAASQGSTAAVATAGRFWASYTIELMDPIPPGVNA